MMSLLTRIALAAFVGAIAAASLAAPAAAGADERAVAERFFGIHARNLLELGKQPDGVALERHVSAIEAAGIEWARVGLDWHQIEPWLAGDDHVYDWSFADRMIGALARHGVEPVPQVWSTPYWARKPAGQEMGCRQRSAMRSKHVGNYGDFVEAVMRRYGRRGSFWASNPDVPTLPVERVELWNEPNHRGFWCPTPNPETFATVLTAGARAIRRVDRAATVVLGGLALTRRDVLNSDGSLRTMAPDTFVSRAIAKRPRLVTLLDEVGVHPYKPTADESLSLLAWLRRKLEPIGLGRAGLLITEFGWPTSGAWSVSEEQRVARYFDYLDKLPRTDCWITGIAPSAWTSPEQEPAYNEHWFGIADPVTAELYPSAEAYTEQIASWRGEGVTARTAQVLAACPAAPRIAVLRRPARRTRARRAAIRFKVRAADGAATRCRIDRRRWRRCGSPLRLRRLRLGRHLVRIRARTGQGRAAPAKVRFRVLRRR